MKNIRRLVLALAATCPFSLSSASTSSSCYPVELGESMVKGDFSHALTLSNSCAAAFMIGAQKDAVGQENNDLSSVYRVSSIQILAIMGDLNGAHKAWDELRAELTSRKPDDLWDVILAGTEGILYEKETQPRLARVAYAKCLNTSYCAGRLAVMAFREKNYIQAARWAELGIKSNDPAAFAIFGELARTKGDTSIAAQAYEKADFLIKASAESAGNLPIYFAEEARIRERLKLTLDGRAAPTSR